MNSAVKMLMFYSALAAGNIPPPGTFFRIINDGNNRITNDGDFRVTN